MSYFQNIESEEMRLVEIDVVPVTNFTISNLNYGDLFQVFEICQWNGFQHINVNRSRENNKCIGGKFVEKGGTDFCLYLVDLLPTVGKHHW